jgi:hypothetical protein
MTIIQQEPLVVHKFTDPEELFRRVKAEVIAAIEEDRREYRISEEKKKLSRAPITYQEFKDLVSTVDLVPFKRGAQGRISSSDD